MHVELVLNVVTTELLDILLKMANFSESITIVASSNYYRWHIILGLILSYFLLNLDSAFGYDVVAIYVIVSLSEDDFIRLLLDM